MTQDVMPSTVATDAGLTATLIIGATPEADAEKPSSPTCRGAVRRIPKPAPSSMVRLAVLHALRPVTYVSRFWFCPRNHCPPVVTPAWSWLVLARGVCLAIPGRPKPPVPGAHTILRPIFSFWARGKTTAWFNLTNHSNRKRKPAQKDLTCSSNLFFPLLHRRRNPSPAVTMLPWSALPCCAYCARLRSWHDCCCCFVSPLPPLRRR